MDKETKKLRSRSLRRNATKAEKILWDRIRRKQLGVKFRRQSPKVYFILDFYCPQKLLGIELDGRGHNKNYDKWRDQLLKRFRNITIIRFENKEVYNDIEQVITTIKTFI